MDPARDVVFGHEFCCEIVEHGPGTEKRLKPGTLVCSMPMTIAGTTVQGIGYSNDIAGGFAQYMPLAERLLLEVPNGLPADKAALTEPIAVGWHAVQNARLDARRCAAGDRLRAGRAVGDRRPEDPRRAPDHRRGFLAGRRALAQRMGADIVIDPAETSPYQSLEGRRDAGGLRRQPLRAAVRQRSEAAPGGDVRMCRRARRHPADHRRRAGRCAHRGGRRVHGDRPVRTVLRHHQTAQPAVRAGLYRRGVRRRACTISPKARWT